MKRAWFTILIGDQELPIDIRERADFLQFMDGHHVLGQLATTKLDHSSGKTHDVLENAVLRTAFDSHMLEFEMNRVERAFLGEGLYPILLKGAAYVASGSSAGRGRRVSDIDILLPEDDMSKAEALLKAAGWEPEQSTENEYDQQYYREHMHELPPLRHQKRRTIMDVHHQLLPKTARIKIDTAAFIKAATVLEGRALKVFTPIDLFLHSAIHAFADGSFDTPMRTMLELWHLLAEIPEADNEAFIKRAREIGAEKPVCLALYLLSLISDNRRSKALLKQVGMRGQVFSKAALLAKFDDPEGALLAKAFLYLRSHYLRMPVYKLLPHLVMKAFRRFKIQENPPLPQV